MAGEYDINLSNGTILATLYPLEVSGPDNLSTPRQIQAIDTGAGTFELVGDLTARFIAGFQFNVQGTGGGLSDGSYTVDVGGSTFAAGITTIPVTTAIPSAALPFGEIQYTILDSRTTLSLPSRGTVNYGEYLIDNFVHMLENFAADDSPDTNVNIGTSPFGQPLRGQWWYNTTAGQEGFKYFDGSIWTSNYDMDDGVLIFRDPENTLVPNTDIMLTAAEDSLIPYGFAAASAQAGMVVWTKDNPDVEHPIFRVLSTGLSERLRVEHDGWTETTNNLEVFSHPVASNRSYIHGTLAIGGRPDGNISTTREVDLVTTNTLTVQGNGIAVNSDLANNAAMVLNSPAGMTSYVDFRHGGTLKGHISVNDATAGDPMVINAGVTNDVVMVTGGGNVGINQIDPSRRLDVVGESEFNGDVYVVGSDMIFDNGFGLESAIGGLLKTGPGGKTWQASPADALAAGFVVNDSLGVPTLLVDEVTGTQIAQYNFLVDTDTLFVDAANDRVGVNIVPTHSFDVSGIDARLSLANDIDITSTAADVNLTAADNVNLSATNGATVTGTAQFNNPVGINNAPPNGSPVWLEVTGDIQANSQFRGSNQSAGSPTYSFSSSTTSGMFYVPAVVGSPAAPAAVGIAVGGNEQLRIQNNGALNVPVGYELLVTDDSSIPNKKYVDDTIISNALQDIVEDTTPQLGGDLDVNGNNIILGSNVISAAAGSLSRLLLGGSTVQLRGANSTSGTNVQIEAGAGSTTIGGSINLIAGDGNTVGGYVNLNAGNATTTNGAIIMGMNGASVAVDVRYSEAWSNGSNYIALKAPDSVTTDRTWTLPQDDPALVTGQLLTTDASGILSFADGLVIEGDGTLSVPASSPGYETLVTDDNDIPNKKYVDDTIPPDFEHQAAASATGSPAVVVSTTVNTTAASGGKSFLQVFIDRNLQLEGVDFTVTGTNEITLAAPIAGSPATFELIIYSWS